MSEVQVHYTHRCFVSIEICDDAGRFAAVAVEECMGVIFVFLVQLLDLRHQVRIVEFSSVFRECYCDLKASRSIGHLAACKE